MKNYYIGIDLGTSNSACALFDGNDLQVVRNSQGGSLTPSVVRMNAKAQVTVGQRARRYLERDPANTRTGFKRLMGTEQQLDFPASGQQKTPTELSAAIITSLLDDVEQQFNFRPTQALVTVPALFDLPQSNMTAVAAKAAGLSKVELLQEPVASALAAGWNEESLQERWLIFDLGGGTFDVSLLEYREGMLRVVAHDGDNFLGGRDFDTSLTDWAIAKIKKETGLLVHRDQAEHNEILRLLALAVEEAKIDLSTRKEASITLFSDIKIDGQPLEVDLHIDRPTLESLCLPVIERAITICKKLLRENSVPNNGGLNQVVVVGGPSMMPIIRKQVELHLAPIASGSLDPMTLVAQGAALYAATTGLQAKKKEVVSQSGQTIGNKMLLQHPSMSADLQPVVLGRLIEKVDPVPVSVRLVNQENNWISEKVALEDDVFMLDVPLVPKTSNSIVLQAFDESGREVLIDPQQLSIVHGLSISDPPLSRTIGLALANGQVHRFFDRGTPLPVKRTFTHHSVDTVMVGESSDVLIIPIVQGEFDESRYCHSIGSLRIEANALEEPLAAGTPIEIMLELDRGGNLKAQAFVPLIAKLFTGVLHLLTPSADLKTLRQQAAALHQRLTDLQKKGFQGNNPKRVSLYAAWQCEFEDVERDLILLTGSNEDAGLRAGSCLITLEAKIDQEEAILQLEERMKDDELDVLYDCSWIEEYGTDQERNMLTRALKNMNQAAERKNLMDYSRQREIVRRLAQTAFDRSSEAWPQYFFSAVARIHEVSDLPKGNKLVEEGHKALGADDQLQLKNIVREIWQLLPLDQKTRMENFDSGIR